MQRSKLPFVLIKWFVVSNVFYVFVRTIKPFFIKLPTAKR